MSNTGKRFGRGAGGARRLVAAAVLVAGVATALPAEAAPAAPTRVHLEQCDLSSLAAAVAGAPELGRVVIRLRCDGVIAGDTLQVTGQRDVTIDATGRDVVFDGRDAVLPFFVGGQSVLRLRHLTVRNGSSDPLPAGGAIYNRGSLHIDDVLFENNHGYNGGGAISSIGAGSVTINNSRFVGNRSTCHQAAAGGGAVSHASSGALTIVGSTFAQNRAVGLGAGGAIYLRPDTGTGPVGNAVIRRSTFSGNTSEVDASFLTVGGGGGALSSHGRPVTVADSVFIDNTSNHRAGAIHHTRDTYLYGFGYASRGPGGSLTVVRSTFAGNSATAVGLGGFQTPGLGGAVVVEGPDAFRIDASAFRDNHAPHAGALATLSPGSISSSLFERNDGTDADRSQQADALFANGSAAVVRLTKTVLRDHGSACTAVFGATFVDGGRNREEGGSTCGVAARPARPL